MANEAVSFRIEVPRESTRPQAQSDAARTARGSFVRIIDSPVAGLGVVTTRFLMAGALLGQYRGRILLEPPPRDAQSRYIVAASASLPMNPRVLYWIDAESSTHTLSDIKPPLITTITPDDRIFTPADQLSTWTRFVNSVDPRTPEAQNVAYVYLHPAYTARVKEPGVYLETTRVVAAGEELLANYGEDYFYVDADNLDIVTSDALTDDEVRARIRAVVSGTPDEAVFTDAVIADIVRRRLIDESIAFFATDTRTVAFIIVSASRIVAMAVGDVMNRRDVLDVLITYARILALISSRRDIRIRTDDLYTDQWVKQRYGFHFDPRRGVFDLRILVSDVQPLTFTLLDAADAEQLVAPTTPADVAIERLRINCRNLQVQYTVPALRRIATSQVAGDAVVGVDWYGQRVAVLVMVRDMATVRLDFACVAQSVSLNIRALRDFVFFSLVHYYEHAAAAAATDMFVVRADATRSFDGDEQVRLMAELSSYTRERRRSAIRAWNYVTFMKPVPPPSPSTPARMLP